MNKTNIAIILLLAILLFAGADYILNITRTARPEPVTIDTHDEYPNLTQELLSFSPATLEYQITRRYRTTQIFEKIDLSALKNLRIYKSVVETPEKIPLVLYEVQGPENQGGVSYLSLKLAFRNQIDATESLNETNEFGHGSFYFNDSNVPETTFLVVQGGDHLYGFQFQKTNPEALNRVKNMIQALMNVFNS